MPMARSRRVLSCAPRVLALFGELWHTFPGLLQLEKYFCTGVLESSGIPSLDCSKLKSTFAPVLQTALADLFLQRSNGFRCSCPASAPLATHVDLLLYMLGQVQASNFPEGDLRPRDLRRAPLFRVSDVRPRSLGDLAVVYASNHIILQGLAFRVHKAMGHLSSDLGEVWMSPQDIHRIWYRQKWCS
jgi:hypothetical protein